MQFTDYDKSNINFCRNVMSCNLLPCFSIYLMNDITEDVKFVNTTSKIKIMLNFGNLGKYNNNNLYSVHKNMYMKYISKHVIIQKYNDYKCI